MWLGVQAVALFGGQPDNVCQNLNNMPFNLLPLPVRIYPVDILAQVYKDRRY